MASKVTPYDLLSPNVKAGTPLDNVSSRGLDDIIGKVPPQQKIPQQATASAATSQPIAQPQMSQPKQAGVTFGQREARRRTPSVYDAPPSQSLSGQAAEAATTELNVRKAKKGLEKYIAGGKVEAQKEYDRLVKIFGPEVRDWLPPTYFFQDKNGNFMPVEYVKALLVGSQSFYDHKTAAEKAQFDKDKYKTERADKDRKALEEQDAAPWQKVDQAKVMETLESPEYKGMNSEELAQKLMAASGGKLTKYGEQLVKVKQQVEAGELKAKAEGRTSIAGAIGQERAEYSQINTMRSQSQTNLEQATKDVDTAKKTITNLTQSIEELKAERDGDLKQSKIPFYADRAEKTNKAIAAAETSMDIAKKKLEEKTSNVTKFVIEKSLNDTAQIYLEDGRAKTASQAMVLARSNLDKKPKEIEPVEDTPISTPPVATPVKAMPTKVNGEWTDEALIARDKYLAEGNTHDQTTKKMEIDGWQF